MSGLFHPIRLSHEDLPGNLLLAPMAGYSDMAFRSIAVSYGASFTFTEMISAEAIARGNVKTFRLLHRAPNERLYGIQIFTGNYQSAVLCAKAIEPFAPFLIDLNCGCAVPKILKSGAGAQLLKEPKKIGAIVKAIVEATSVPVSVKLRLGWDSDSLSYEEAAEEAVRHGACLVSLHPRTRAQGFTGKADWTHIKNLTTRLPVPVIGSGDLFSPEDALRMLTETGCAGVMFARGAIGNPFIFRETYELLHNVKSCPEITVEEKLMTALRQLELLASYKTEKIASREMRKHFAHYTRGFPHSTLLRRAVNSAETIAQYREIVQNFLSLELEEANN